MTLDKKTSLISGILDRPDAVLRYDQQGSGPDILLLHAGGERRRVWHEVMRSLTQRGFRTLAYDQRGHGESGGRRDASLPAFGADTAAMIARLTAPVVVGASLGGFAAFSALADPDVQACVSGLVLIDVLPDPDPIIVRSFLSRDGVLSTRAAQVEDILGRAEEMRAAAAALSLPVLVVRAGQTSPIRDGDADRFLELVPHATFVTVPDAGHLVARDKPLELAAAIGAFMSSDAVRDRRSSQISSHC